MIDPSMALQLYMAVNVPKTQRPQSPARAALARVRRAALLRLAVAFADINTDRNDYQDDA